MQRAALILEVRGLRFHVPESRPSIVIKQQFPEFTGQCAADVLVEYEAWLVKQGIIQQGQKELM